MKQYNQNTAEIKKYQDLAQEIYEENYKSDYPSLTEDDFNKAAIIYLATSENKNEEVEILGEGSVRVESENYELWTDKYEDYSFKQVLSWLTLAQEIYNSEKEIAKIEIVLK